MKGEAGYLRMGRAPLPRLEVPAIRVLQISGFLFVAEAACQVDERLFLPERRSRVGVLLSWSRETGNFGILERSSSMLNCRWIKKGFRSFAFGISRARIVTRSIGLI